MAIQYTLRIPQPHTHYVEVTATFPAGQPLDLMLPVWTPGSYLVREYSRQIDEIPGCTKTAKNRWRAPGGGVISYRVYCHELTVRTNYVDAQFALIIPAATFLTSLSLSDQPHEVTIEHSYAQAHTGLPSTSKNQFRAANYDQLVDCPIYLGNPAVHEFTVEGKSHLLVNEAESGSWDGPASAAAAKKIVQQYAKMMRGLPYDRYLFLNLIVESGGGIEHANSTVLMASRWAWGNTDNPKADPREAAKPSRHGWLDLVSHEFFHAWNVKRLRPIELGPFDYEKENYTESLWFAEGVTSYYGPLMARRAGLAPDQAFLTDLSRIVGQVQGAPGRLVQSLADASRDAWIKHYRPQENSSNTTISYYTKGALVAWILDVRIRQATNNQKSLDDAIRLAYSRFSGAHGFSPSDLFALFDEVAGQSLQVRPLVDRPGELDYSGALAWLGLRFTPAAAGKPWLGAQLKAGVIEGITANSPAHHADLAVGDELIAIDGHRLTPDNLDRVLASAGAKAKATYSRRGRLRECPLQPSPEPRRAWQLEMDPSATPEQRRNFASWLQSY